MSKFVDTPTLSALAGEALAKYRRVKISAAGSTSTPPTIVYADAGERGIGVVRAAVASGDPVTVHLDNKHGTQPAVAAAAITALANVYPANDGKVTSTPTGLALGKALDAATANSDVIEVLPQQFDSFMDMASKFVIADDFINVVLSDADRLWTSTLTDSGTATIGDAAGGILALAASDGTIGDNDEAYHFTTNEVFLFANGKPLWFEARVALAAADTDGANVIVGFVSAANAVNTLLDNGGGPPASYSGAVFYKVDGGSAWAAEVSIAGTQTAVTLTSPGAPSTTYQKLAIEFIPTSSTTATVNFYIDGTLVGSTTTFTYTSATEMNAGVGVKNGGTSVNTTLNVDYINVAQVR